MKKKMRKGQAAIGTERKRALREKFLGKRGLSDEDEVGFIHPSQFATLNEEASTSTKNETLSRGA
ncbi:hypothetical protein L484_024503 [Morus notabilis]|uniref:Uncharacterized protein n=1 Tax=Morus notabilis TaxID=981085 RepID=W9RT63_9ROSA|nr:hypothetical protein L484_024503 [Morus notabilis]